MLEIYVIDSVKVIGNKRVIKRFPQGRGVGGKVEYSLFLLIIRVTNWQ